jgi:RHS repeat-associated protein
MPWLGGGGPAPAAVAQPPSRAVSGPAAVSFTNPVGTAADTGAFGVASGDFNGDGKQDLAVADRGANNVAVLLGRGDGGFRPAVKYAAGTCPQGVAVGSLRGNGKLDIIVANNCSSNFSILLGNGDGTFQPAVSSSLTGSPWGVAVADFNRDGKLDVVVSMDGTQSVAVLFGNGDGTVGVPAYYAGNHGGENGVAIGDFNGDGYPDIVAADGGPPGADWATASVFLNAGNGTFGAAAHYNIGNTYAITHSVVVADLNRDGKQDIVAVNQNCGYNGGDVLVLLGNGNGTFQNFASIGDGCPAWATVADMNGDGIPDIISANPSGFYNSTNNIRVFLGYGNGTFQSPYVFGLSNWSPAGITSMDLNGDGRPDVVTANVPSNDVTVLVNTSPAPPKGGVVPAAEHSAGPSGTAPYVQGSCGCHGQPIDTAYGNFWHTFSDLAVPGRGIQLGLSHTYSSVNAAVGGPLGYGWTYSYAMSLGQDPVTGNVTIHEENGGQAAFTLSGGVYSAPPRDIATLVKNPDGTFTFVRQARQRYTFNASGQLTAQTDLNGYATTLAYNVGGQLSTVTDPASRSLTFTWAGANLTQVSDPIGRTVSYAYNDGLGNLTDVTDANGGVTHFTYDANHMVLTMTDPLGQVTTNVYTSNRVTSQTETVVVSDRTKDRTTTFAYAGDNSTLAGGTVTITDPKGNVTVEQYSYGERLSVTKGYGTSNAATWNYLYDTTTLALVTVTDPNGHITQMSHDASGNLLTTTDALNRFTSNTYDGLNDLTSTTDPNGVTTTLAYDGAANVQSRSTPLVGSSPAQSQTTTYTYGDPSHPGDVTSLTDPDTKVWQTSHDQYGDMTSQTDPLGNVATSQYNAVGWKISTVSPRGNVSGCGCASQHTTTYNYTDLRTGRLNGFGDVGTATDPLGHTAQKTYDPNRNLISLKDGDGKITQYSYDLADEQTVVTRADMTTLKTDYNADGTVVDQVDGLGRTTSYGYDTLARVTSVTDPRNRITSATYDGAGNRLTVTDPQSPAQTTTYTYDAANQLASISYSDGRTPNVSGLMYDADGQRTSMSDGTGTSTWVWDSLHRLTSATNGAAQATGYGYDLKGQLTSITYPGSHTVSRIYDDAGRLHTVTDWLSHTTTYTDDPDSNVTNQAYPNGTSAALTVDAGTRVMGISDAPTSNPTSPFASFTYGRDSNNQLTAATSTGVPADNNTYGYTALNQVNQVNAATYGYDAADNLTTLASGTVQSYDVANELTQAQASISLVGTASGEIASGTSLTVSLPGGVQANDQIVVATTQPATVTVSNGGGYTLVQSAETGTHSSDTQTFLYRRTAVSGDTAVTFTYGKATAAAVVIAVYRGVNPSSPVDAFSYGTTSSGTQVTAPSVTSTLSSERLIMVEGATGRRVASWTQPTGMTDQVHRSDLAAVSSALGDQTLASAGATGTRMATFGTSTALVGILVALKPAVTTFGFDPRGNRTAVTLSGGTATSLGYDQANRLVSYGTSATYAYNGDGLRMSKTVSGVTTPFTWDVAEGPPLLLYDGSTSYIYGQAGQPLEQISSSGTALYFHQDQLGSTRLLTDQSGIVQASYTYDTYGNLTGKTGTATTPLLYSGGYTDTESGFEYLRARYYDAATGQFLSRDPVAAKTGQPYSYVGDNPLNATDPSGLYEYYTTWNLGRAGSHTPEEAMWFLQHDPNAVFPWHVEGAAGENSLELGHQYNLHTNTLRPCIPPFGCYGPDPVIVVNQTPTSFTFLGLSGHIEGFGSTITFSTYCQNGNLMLQQHAQGPDSPLEFVDLGRINGVRMQKAQEFWGGMANRLAALLNGDEEASGGFS